MYDEIFLEQFSLDPMKEMPSTNELMSQTFTEAVFANGKSQVLPLVETIQKIKDLLESEIKQQDDTVKEVSDARKKRKNGEPIKTMSKVKQFDPKSFWKNTLFKELEDQIGSIFGFRNVEIHPYIEKYNSSDKTFQSRIMNCEIYHTDRYPIEGLVSDKGFYDKSKSLMMQIRISLGLVRSLNAEEILSVLLHEFGHSIDPALVDIKYTEMNILSKYLTDRKHAINKSENKMLNKRKLSEIDIILIPALVVLVGLGISRLISFIKEKIDGKEKTEQKKLDKIKKLIDADKGKFDRQNYSEAYADNFARMYGFGPQLMSALKKLSSEQNRLLNSRYKKEKDRQEYIIYITGLLIDDVHKTDIHRIRNLINEYNKDINDPNTSPVVKKQLQDDLSELEKVLNEYLNNFSDFQNRVNSIINEELSKVKDDSSSENKSTPNKKEEAIKEGFEFFDDTEVFEEKHPLQERMEDKCPLNKGDLARFKEKFGSSKSCSFAKDKDGYFAYTHRCRSKSHKTIEDFPQKDVDFVRSTS